jgi:diaminopimelate decarboxylase
MTVELTPMHSFHYREGRLFCEEVDLAKAAEQFGTPLYLYSASTILDHYQRLDQELGVLDHQIFYAIKANSNGAILKLLADAGAGFDIVSGGELYRVLKTGGNPNKCTFAGVGKSREEIEYALEERVYCFNVESEAELEYINEIASKKGVRAPIALRVNPGVDAPTHEYVATGARESKFGIALARATAIYERAARLDAISILGVQMHIGSQIMEAQPFVEAIEKIEPLVKELKARYAIEFFSIGGGLGIEYESSIASGSRDWWRSAKSHGLTIADYVAAITPPLTRIGLRIGLEPGRLLVGNAGVLLTRVIYMKESGEKNFAIVDAGMNDLIRPALYGSYHEIVPVAQPSPNERMNKIDIVGPVCESGDFFAQDREMPTLRASDLLAIMSAGAYGFVMASNYNARPLPAEVMVRRDRMALIRKRQTVEELTRGELGLNWEDAKVALCNVQHD